MSRDDSISARVERLELPFDAFGYDPFGVSKRHLEIAYKVLSVLYRNYFSVRVEGLEHVPDRGRAMLVGNHSGGYAIDAMTVFVSTFLEKEQPRLAHGMAERFLNRLPWSSTWTARTGHFTGLPEHAIRLLEDDRLLMVFPEGANGTAKLYKERNSLVDFGTGFVRLAMQTGSPIVPFGFAGGGSAVPTVMNLYALGKLLGVPYVPVTPYLLALPRPVTLSLCYGEPMYFEGSGNEDDAVVLANVEKVKGAIRKLIERARKKRRPWLLKGRSS